MTDVFSKISDTEIKVVKTETKEVEHTYNYDFLLKQKATIEAQKAREMAQRDLELAEVNALIAECIKLGITKKVEPIEVVVKEVVK